MVGEAIQMYRLVVSCLAPANILDGVVSLKDPSGLTLCGNGLKVKQNFPRKVLMVFLDNDNALIYWRASVV